MLDILRRKSSSIITKLILGFIVIVFVFYFGSSILREGIHADSEAAQVNGAPILKAQWKGLVKAQKRANSSVFEGLPPEMAEQFERSMLTSLVRDKVMEQQANKGGLRVTVKELAKKIQELPPLQGKDGKFDFDFYTSKYRPFYLYEYGIDIEKVMAESLLIDKMDGLIRDSFFQSKQALKNDFLIENNQLKFQKVVISPDKFFDKFTPDDEAVKKKMADIKGKAPVELKEDQAADENTIKTQAIAELKMEEGKKRRDELVTRLWSSFKDGKISKEALKKEGLDLEEPDFISASKLDSLIDGEQSPEILSQLSKLSKENPVTSEPIHLGQSVYFLRLVDKKVPDLAEFEKQWADKTARGKLEDPYYNLLKQAQLDAWMEKARISYK